MGSFVEMGSDFLAFIGVAYLGIGGAAAVFQRHLVFPRHAITDDERNAGIAVPGVSEIRMITPDGHTLKAYWKAPAPGAPVIVTFHGNAGTPQPYVERFSSGPWAQSGYGVLGIAYRGYPGSSGKPSEKGLLIDGQAAFEYARKHAPASSVVIHGHSLGSGVAIATAAENDALALVVEAPFTSLIAAAQDQYPLAPVPLLLDRFRSDRRIMKVTARRIHILHGTDDRVIPSSHAVKLGRIRPDACITMLAGEDHVSLLGVRDKELEQDISALHRMLPRTRDGVPSDHESFC